MTTDQHNTERHPMTPDEIKRNILAKQNELSPARLNLYIKDGKIALADLNEETQRRVCDFRGELMPPVEPPAPVKPIVVLPIVVTPPSPPAPPTSSEMRERWLSNLADDPNYTNSSDVRTQISQGVLTDVTDEEWEQRGIDPRFIEAVREGQTAKTFDIPTQLEQVRTPRSTEIYFWGCPSSGKSCALGAILSVAANGGVAKSLQMDRNSQGYGYMLELKDLFRENCVCSLPEANSLSAAYEMGFDLIDDKDREHPVTCIDFAGEVLHCMYLDNAHKTMDEREEAYLNTADAVLEGYQKESMKMHFFVLEYGAENKRFKGIFHKSLLESAVEYIDDTGIFRSSTQAIYLIITKSDKARPKAEAEGRPLPEVLEEYVRDNYQGFYNNLQHICRSNDINGGNISVIPFSIGEVCFQDLCLFNAEPAKQVVKNLLEQTKGFRVGRRWNFFNGLKK